MGLLDLFTRKSVQSAAEAEAVRAAAFFAEADRKAAQFIEERAGLPLTKLGDYQSFSSTATGKVWATFRACDLTGSVLQSSTMAVRSKKTGVAVENTPLALLLDKPNSFDSIQELLYMWAYHIMLTGSAYWLLDEVDGAGRPGAVYALIPAFVKVVPSKTDRIQEYIYSVNGTEIKLPRQQIVHWRRPHPNSFIFGLGDIEGSSTLHEGYINRAALEEKFLSNGAVPSGILSRKDTVDDPDKWAAFTQKFKKEYAGRANAGKIAFLNGDWAYHQLGITPKAMETVARERFAIEQVFASHGVPLSVAGLDAASNYATAQQEDINFRRYKCLPLLNLFLGKLNAAGGLVQRYSPDWMLTGDIAGTSNVEQLGKEWLPLVKAGIITPNELREIVGMPKAEDPLMDQFYVPSTQVPIELSGHGDIPGGDNQDDL